MLNEGADWRCWSHASVPVGLLVSVLGGAGPDVNAVWNAPDLMSILLSILRVRHEFRISPSSHAASLIC